MINTTQLVARTDKRTIGWLESKGFRNLLPNDYTFPVFIIDRQDKTFFGTNTTCMAAACSCGRRPEILGFEKIIDKL